MIVIGVSRKPIIRITRHASEQLKEPEHMLRNVLTIEGIFA